MKNKKCHNCINGYVDGGSNRRIEREIKILIDKKHEEIYNIKEKDKEKAEHIRHIIRQKYDKLIYHKDKEKRFISKCGYCKGTGFKK